jgi:hypothetical protein
VTIFLDDSITIAGSPKIVLMVDGAAMGDIRNDFPVAKAIHHIAVGIEFDVRWRLLRDFGFLVRHVIPMNDEDVILCVHAYTADLSDYPFSWQRLWPVGIDNEFRTVGVCLRAAIDSQGDRQDYAKPNLSEQPYLPVWIETVAAIPEISTEYLPEFRVKMRTPTSVRGH